MSCHCQVRSKVGVPFKRGSLPKLALVYNFKVVKNCDVQRFFCHQPSCEMDKPYM